MRRRDFVAVCITFVFFSIIIPIKAKRRLFQWFKKPLSLHKHELRTVAALADIIFPESEIPGALTLGIENFLSRQSHTPYFAQYIPSIKRVSNILDQLARSNQGKTFLSCQRQGQENIIARIASGELESAYPGLQRDFHALIDLTLEGCFADSVHGGNKNLKAWDIMKSQVKVAWFDV